MQQNGNKRHEHNVEKHTRPDAGPTFNLKAVVRETGLKHDTLRAWERRYGLPNPRRTAGGHRLYTERDIEILKWLIARQEEGLTISRAVAMWRRLEADNQDPSQVPAPIATAAAIQPILAAKGQVITELRQAWESACFAFDEQSAENIMAQAFALYPPEVVCFELLLKAVAHIGQGWYEGDVTVQQEHFASALAVRRLEALIAATPAPTRLGRLLVGCPAQEEHIFSPLLITLLLRRQGRDVIYLGANVPAARLETTTATTNPQLVILSAQILPTAANLLETAQLLQRERIPVAFGGRIFNIMPKLRSRIPGYFLGERLDTVPGRVDRLLESPRPIPPVKIASKAYEEALYHYRERQALIEAAVWQALDGSGFPQRDLTLTNTSVAEHVKAALTLGDINLLGTDMAWIDSLLAMINQRLPAKHLPGYWQAYHQAVEKHLDKRGQPIKAWLAQLTSEIAQINIVG